MASVDGLTSASRTLLLPLYCRVVESGHADPIIQDPIAADLLTRIDFDFAPIAGRKFDCVVAMLRAGSV